MGGVMSASSDSAGKGLAAYVAVAVAAVSAGAMALMSIDSHDEAVLNPSASADVANWHSGSSSSNSPVKLSRARIEDGPRGVSTALQVRRTGDGGEYSYALAGLKAPQEFFVSGETYRMRAYVRDRLATGRAIGMLLANSNFKHRPTEMHQDGRYTDDSWHLLQRTFVAHRGAESDTGLYFVLPIRGTLHWEVTLASVRKVTLPEPPVSDDDSPKVLSFDGEQGAPPDRSTWTPQLGGAWGDGELQSYTANIANAQLDGDGHLVLTARPQRFRGEDGISRDYTSARLSTAGKVQVPPGSYVEASIRAPVGGGITPAFWLLGSNIDTVGWPACGELDIMEASQRSSSTIRQTLHTAAEGDRSRDSPYGGHAPGGFTELSTRRDSSFHRYGVYFDGSVVQFYVDGEATLKLTRAEAFERGRTWPFGRPQDIILNIAIARVPRTSDLPARMEVSDIRIWSGGVPRGGTFGRYADTGAPAIGLPWF